MHENGESGERSADGEGEDPARHPRRPGVDRSSIAGNSAIEGREERHHRLLDPPMLGEFCDLTLQAAFDRSEDAARLGTDPNPGFPERAVADEDDENRRGAIESPCDEEFRGKAIGVCVRILPTNENVDADAVTCECIGDQPTDVVPASPVEDGPVVGDRADGSWELGGSQVCEESEDGKAGRQETRRMREQCSHVTIPRAPRARSTVLPDNFSLQPLHVP